MILAGQPCLVTLDERQAGTLGEFTYRERKAATGRDSLVVLGDLGLHEQHLIVEQFVFNGPGAVLVPGSVDHAVDEIDFDLIAGAEPGHVRVAS